jgi:hypothetical protein
VGLIDEDAGIEALCRNEGIEHLRLESPHRNPDNGRHWTADGHAEISRQLFDFFQKGLVSLPALAPRRPRPTTPSGRGRDRAYLAR